MGIQSFFQLPYELLEHVFSYIPDHRSSLQVRASSRQGRGLFNELVSRNPAVVSRHLSILINNDNGAHLGPYLESLPAASSSVPVRVTISRYSDDLAEHVSKIHTRFRLLSLNFRSLTSQNMPRFRAILEACPTLFGLSVTTCDLQPADFQTVTLPRSLKQLNLFKVPQAGVAVRACTELQELCLMVNSTESIPSTVRKLDLPFAAIDGRGLEDLFRRCTALESLDLRRSRVPASAFRQANYPVTLKTLNLDNTAVDQAGVDQVKRLCTGLQKLSIVRC